MNQSSKVLQPYANQCSAVELERNERSTQWVGVERGEDEEDEEDDEGER